MNTQQLKCFIAVADRLNFTKASKMLFLSVPTVTHHIKTLEYELDTTLLIRSKHQVTLTNDGKNFYNQAVNILKIEEEFKYNLKIEKKTIKVICTSYNELDLLVKTFNELEAYKPEISVIDYSQGLYKIKHLEADVMLGSDNMALEEKDLDFRASKNATSYLILKKDDPLNSQKKIYFKDLEDKTIIRLHNILIPFYSRNKIKDLINIHSGINKDFICDDEQVALANVLMNYGVCVIPEYRIPKYLDEDLAIRNIEENQPFKYGIITNPINNFKGINDFTNVLEKTLKTYTFNEAILSAK